MNSLLTTPSIAIAVTGLSCRGHVEFVAELVTTDGTENIKKDTLIVPMPCTVNKNSVGTGSPQKNMTRYPLHRVTSVLYAGCQKPKLETVKFFASALTTTTLQMNFGAYFADVAIVC
jgi:hypothetical protein